MQVRQLILTASALVMAGAGPAHAQNTAPVAGDSGLQSLVAEALARNPTVAQRQAAVRAATLRHQRELLDAAVQLSTTRYATGAAPQSDPLQAKLARDRLRSEEFALESERVAALAAVNALRNRAPGDSVPVTAIEPAALHAGAGPQPPADSL